MKSWKYGSFLHFRIAPRKEPRRTRVEPPGVDLAPEISKASISLARGERHSDRCRASFSFAISEPVEVTA
jgi:hypothetical protein